jgi:hypothetical protein
MNINDLVTQIYKKLTNANVYKLGWAILDENLYNKINDKILITSIDNLNKNEHKESTCLLEDKDQYYLIKWNDKFISINESDNEYGLVLNELNIYAINAIKALENKPNLKTPSLKKVLKIIGFKLSKKAKEHLNYFDSF